MKLTIVNKIDGSIRTFNDRPSSKKDAEEMIWKSRNIVNSEEWDYILISNKSKKYQFNENDGFWEWEII